jgi:DNA-binding transcriptional ArsR family regulator
MNDGTPLGATLTALSDPTRRAVIDLLVAQPRRAGELAQALSMTPPALSRHLRVLRKSGLIVDDEPEDDARVRLYRLRPDGFGALRDWVAEISAFWGDQLQAFKAHAEKAAVAKSGGRSEARGLAAKPVRRRR